MTKRNITTLEYHFSTSEILLIQNVIRLDVRKDGTHAVDVDASTRMIVPGGWKWLVIRGDDLDI